MSVRKRSHKHHSGVKVCSLPYMEDWGDFGNPYDRVCPPGLLDSLTANIRTEGPPLGSTSSADCHHCWVHLLM